MVVRELAGLTVDDTREKNGQDILELVFANLSEDVVDRSSVAPSNDNMAQRLDGLLEGRDYLLSDHPCLADVALLPFVRQFAHVDREWFAQTPYVRLQAWLQRFLESNLFTSIMKK